MRISGEKIILLVVGCLLLSLFLGDLVVGCLLLSFVLYSLYLVDAVVVAATTKVVQSFGIVMGCLLIAILFLCISICFMLFSPLEFVRVLLQLFALPN